MKNILHIRSGFTSGGTETLLLHLFNARQPFFRIHLALLKEGPLAESLKRETQNHLHRLYRRRFLDLAVLSGLSRIICKEEISLVHTHQFIELCYAALLKLRHPKLQIVHHIHGMFPEKDWTLLPERWLSQGLATVVTVSEAARTELAERFGFRKNKVQVLPNAVLAPGQNPYSRKEAEARLGLPAEEGVFRVVMVANFLWGKDHETVFRAYRDYIREQLPQLRLYFIGRENERSEELAADYLEESDRERVVLLGQRTNARDLLPAFDLCLMSSYSETFGLVILEALLAGLPVLASDIPAFCELSEQGRRFPHFRTGDARNLYEQLSQMCEGSTLKAMPDNAAYFRHRYGFHQFLERLNALYEGQTPHQEPAFQS